ncbi:hypothetical protein EVC45_43875, partial [Paraburkholderia sp. UYCP14C]
MTLSAPSPVHKKFINRPVGWFILRRHRPLPQRASLMYTQSLDIPGNVAPLDADANSPEQAR